MTPPGDLSPQLPGTPSRDVFPTEDLDAADLAADSYSTDNDSAYGDEISTYTTSITTSATDYPEIHGRRYHAYREGRYALPNDELESERLDIFHLVMRKCMNGQLFFAPIDPDPHRVIDIGTGTGIWAIQFADEYPSAEVLGNDLSPIQPNLIPNNLRFIVDDIEDDWGYENQPFDFVHARFLTGAIRNWPALVAQAYQNTRKGGWAEFQDWDTFLYSADGTLPPDSALNRFHVETGLAREAQGFDMKPGRLLEGWMRDAGFVNVQAHKILLPLGPWPKNRDAKELGVWNLLQMESGIEGICLGTLPRADPPWSFDEIQVFLAQIRRDMRNFKIHSLYDMYVVYGQRPV